MAGTQEDSTNHHRVKRYDALKIILFGSHARGEAHLWSDIDLLVVFDEPVDKRETAVGIQRAFNGYLVAVDVIVTWPEEISHRGNMIGNVLRPALREGKLIYERQCSRTRVERAMNDDGSTSVARNHHG